MLPVYLHGIKYIQIQQTTNKEKGKKEENKQPAEREESERERAENMPFYKP
jgi:hypothetical protein